MELNTIYCGEATEVLSTFPDNSIDCIVTSPPYWKGFAYEAYFNSYQQYLEWSYKWIKECKRVLKPTGTFWLNISNDSETTIRAYEIMEIACIKLLMKLHDTIIWNRYNQQPANTNRQLTNQTEFIFMIRKTSTGIELNKEDAYNNAPDMFETKNVGNVWRLPFNSGKAGITGFAKKETISKWGHAGFPIKLPETCILLSTKEGDTILDPFMGSGTTALAAKNTKRNYVGIDKEIEYVELTRNRLKEHL